MEARTLPGVASYTVVCALGLQVVARVLAIQTYLIQGLVHLRPSRRDGR